MGLNMCKKKCKNCKCDAISMDKHYRTRDGQAVRVLCVDRKEEDYPVVALYADKDGEESVNCFTKTGAWLYGQKSAHDLIEVVPYDYINIDDPVYVRESTNAAWKKKHFAGVNKGGLPCIWAAGKTSFTDTASLKAPYKHCLTVEEYEAEYGEQSS